jgi:site-specific DNA recombinase
MALTRVCLYTRISTDEENQPTSLHSQRERLQAFCTAQEDWRIVAHEQDQGSGTKLDRPGVQRALAHAREGRIDLLLCYRVDRLSRKVRQLAQLAEELDSYGVVLRSATEPFDTGSAAGRMMLQMLGVFAEFEHATIVDRISAGIERRAKEGRWFGGRPPFGYTFSDEQRLLVPDPVKAPVVQRIFALYTRDRLGTIAIAEKLRTEQAPAPSAGWGHPAVHFILTNPTYTGKIRWRDKTFDGQHQPLIDEVTFARAQVILRERGDDVSRRRGNASDFLLSGLVRCGRCGRAYIGMSARGNGGTYHYYACTGRQKYGPKACRGERLPQQKLEQAVLRQLADVYREGTLIGKALDEAAAKARQRRPALEHRLASIDAEIARAEQALERYFDAFEQGKLTAERCDERLSRLQARLNDLRGQHAELAASAPDQAAQAPTAAELAAIADQLESVVAQAEPQQAKALLRHLIAELKVNGRADIQPTYRVMTPTVCATSEKVEAAGIEPAQGSRGTLIGPTCVACLATATGERTSEEGAVEFVQLKGDKLRRTFLLTLAAATVAVPGSQATPTGLREGLIVTGTASPTRSGAWLVPRMGAPQIVAKVTWRPLAVSRDGRVAATRATRGSNQPLVILGRKTVIRVPGSKGAACVSWSSSGRRLAYVTGEWAWYEHLAGTAAGGWIGSLWILDTSTRAAPRQVASGLFADTECPQWAPRSETLAYMVGTVDGTRTWSMRREASGASRIIATLDTPVPSSVYRTFAWMPRSDELLLLADDGITSHSTGASRVVVPPSALDQIAAAASTADVWKYQRILSVSPNGRLLAASIQGATGILSSSGELLRVCDGHLMGWSGNDGILTEVLAPMPSLALCRLPTATKLTVLAHFFKLTVVSDPAGRWFAYPDPHGVYVLFRGPDGSLLRRVHLRTPLYFNALAAVGRDGRIAGPAGTY